MTRVYPYVWDKSAFDGLIYYLDPRSALYAAAAMAGDYVLVMIDEQNRLEN